MDNANYLIFKMAIKLVEIKIRDNGEHAKRIQDLPMSGKQYAELIEENKKLIALVNKMKEALMNKDQGNIQNYVNIVTDGDFF